MAEKLEAELEPKVSPTALDRVRQELSSALGGAGIIAGTGLATYAAAGAAAKEFVNVGERMASWVQKANPAVVNRWNNALDDASAIIGHRLAPGLDIMTDLARTVADAFATDRDAANLFKEAWKSLRESVQSVKPALIAAAQGFLTFTGHVARGLSQVVEKITPVIEWLNIRATEAHAQIRGQGFIEQAARRSVDIGTFGKEGAASSFAREERIMALQEKVNAGGRLDKNEQRANEILATLSKTEREKRGQGALAETDRALLVKEMDRLLKGGGESFNARAMRPTTMAGQDISTQLILGALEAGNDPLKQNTDAVEDNTKAQERVAALLEMMNAAAGGGGPNAPSTNSRGTMPRTS